MSLAPPDRVISNFSERLSAQFPKGSRESVLTQSLIAQGFKLNAPCANDVAIHSATFTQVGGLTPIYAVAVWRAASNGTVDWTRGSVAFSGP